ncbi:hypothetical protein [Corynebacterium comes]|uniref:Uncharacterized protein n=1 Tax=Corynebacterium comes TaxID=2675218 RepID=A0A6B8VX89_9CORY|nr:hypothetical protein [Corynebacterium comes]QGU03316.1 hypothetical protein CETAM_00110 [Corynebacterium comes]
MNPATLKMALSAASAVREHLKEYNEKKTREAYDLLSDAASRVDLDELKARSSSLLDEGRREAGLVTQAAHARLDAAKKRLEKASENRPSPKSIRAAKRRRTLTTAGLIALLLSAIAGGVYWFTRQQAKPGDTPPRVEDFAGTEAKAPEAESTLVYSTTTPEEGVPAEVDEELLSSLDEQLEKHRAAAMDEAGENLENSTEDTEETEEAEKKDEEEGVHKK